MRRYPSKDAHGAVTQQTRKSYDEVLIRWVLMEVLNKAADGESLTWSGKSFHNEGAAEVNDLSSHDVLARGKML